MLGSYGIDAVQVKTGLEASPAGNKKDKHNTDRYAS